METESLLHKIDSFESLFYQPGVKGGSWGKERDKYYPQRDEVQSRFKEVRTKSGAKIPETLYNSLFCCLLSQGHLLIDTALGPKDYSSPIGLTITQTLPLLFGLKCSFINCTKLTTPEDLFAKMLQSSSHSLSLASASMPNLHKSKEHVEEQVKLDIRVNPLLEESQSFSDGLPRRRKKKSRELSIHEENVNAPKEPSPIPPTDRVQQVAQAIIIENFELAPVNTQLALFEVMRSQRLVLHGYRYSVSELFCVIALIGNHNDYDARNELTAEMQFLMKIDLTSPISPPNIALEVNPAWSPKELLSMRLSLESIYLSKDIEQYMRNIVMLLRNHPQVKGGVSPLAASAMKHTVRAAALLSGMSFVVPSHVTRIVTSILSHRPIVASNVSVHDILIDVIENEPCPF